MQLVVKQRCEQGTKKGVMLFSPGSYKVKDLGEGVYRVTHEARNEMTRDKDGKRVPKQVYTTDVGKDILDQMVKHGVAEVTE